MLRTRGSSALAGGAGWARLACAGIAGYTALPLVCVMTGATLGGLGFRMGAVPPAGGLTLDLLSQCVIGPVVEELLYRERLLAALRGRCGDALAISLASLIFAVPHARPELVVGLTWLGVPLGLLAARGGSLAPCIALHAGFNLAGVLAGAPSQRLMPSLAPSVAIFALAFVAASGLARRR